MLPTFKEVVEELFAGGPGQGGLRHRDPGARHQHAGPDRGHREAGQVERRDPRRPDAGGVHPAHRPGRPARHRRRGPRRRALAAGHGPGRGGRAWPAPGPTRCNSSFRPSYNMAVNLVGQVGRRARATLLESSFAQFQADRAVVGAGPAGAPGPARQLAGCEVDLRPRRLRRVRRHAPPSCPSVEGELSRQRAAARRAEAVALARAAAPRRHHPGARRPPGRASRWCSSPRPRRPRPRRSC